MPCRCPIPRQGYEADPPNQARQSTRAVCRSVWSSVAAMAEPASGVGGGDRGEGARQLAIEVGDRAGFLGAQGGLGLGPAGLDRGQVGRVARGVAEAEAGGLDPLAHGLGLVGAEIVHGQGGPRPNQGEPREQDLLQEGEEDGGRGGGPDGHRADQPVGTERAQEREPAPAARRRAAGPLAPRRAGMAAGHVGRDAALVEEDQPGGIDRAGVLAVGGTLLHHVLAVPLAGPQGLFLRASPRRSSALRTIGPGTARPARAVNAPAYSGRVAALAAATSPSGTVSPSASIPRDRPRACGSARRRSSSRSRLSQPWSVLSLMAKRRAIRSLAITHIFSRRIN